MNLRFTSLAHSPHDSRPAGSIHTGLRRLMVFFAVVALFAISAYAAFWNLTGNVSPVHDPASIKEGSTWWTFSTGTGIAVRYSGNGLNWTQGIQLFASEPAWWRTYAPNMGTNDPWAPDVHFYNGRYWVYYCVSQFGTNTSAIGLISCSSIAKGDWRDDGVVLTSNSSKAYNALDPSLTFDASGKPWLVFGSWFDGLHVVVINTSTMKPTGTVYSIAKNSAGIEGGCIVHTGGFYYLFASRGVCCQGVNSTYNIVYGRATSITGPYLDRSGVNMLNNGASVLDAGNARWKGPGGQSIVANGSGWTCVRHAYDANNNGAPTLLISDLFFTGGWPTY